MTPSEQATTIGNSDEPGEWHEDTDLTEAAAGPLSDADLDALASDICRRMSEVATDLNRYTEAQAAEEARIQMRYAAIREPLNRRYAALEKIGEELARRADFGKKKSRAVGFGSYGRRTKKECVKIVDPAKALEFARVAAPEAIKTETIEKPVHKLLEPVVIKHVHASGEVPEGFEHTSEREEPFVKPEVEAK